jgi:hypothetical protein
MEYLIQPEDVAEALRWRAPEQRRKIRRGLLGWLVFVAVAAALFVWLKSNAAPAPRRLPNAAPPPSGVWNDFVLPFIPWLLILAFVWFFVFRQLRGRGRKLWEGSAELQQPQMMEVSDQGVRISNVFTEMLYRWNGFVGWAETPNLMLLLLSGQRRLMIPRRAASTEAEWQQFRDLVKSHVSEPLGGFQVMPPKPVLPLETPDATAP